MGKDKSEKWDGTSENLEAAFENLVGKPNEGEIIAQPRRPVIPHDHPSTLEFPTVLSLHYSALENIDFNDAFAPIDWLQTLQKLMTFQGKDKLPAEMSLHIIKIFEERGFTIGGLQIDPAAGQDKFREQLIGLALHEFLHFNTLQKDGFLKYAETYKSKFIL